MWNFEYFSLSVSLSLVLILSLSLGPTGVQEWDIEDTEQSLSSSESGELRPKTKSEDVDEIVAAVDDDVSVSEDICCKEELSETEDNESARV